MENSNNKDDEFLKKMTKLTLRITFAITWLPAISIPTRMFSHIDLPLSLKV